MISSNFQSSFHILRDSHHPYKRIRAVPSCNFKFAPSLSWASRCREYGGRRSGYLAAAQEETAQYGCYQV